MGVDRCVFVLPAGPEEVVLSELASLSTSVLTSA